MRWTERQRAMLREMGIQLWGPGSVETPSPIETVVPTHGDADATAPDGGQARGAASSGAATPLRSGALDSAHLPSARTARGADGAVHNVAAASSAADAAPRLPGLA